MTALLLAWQMAMWNAAQRRGVNEASRGRVGVEAARLSFTAEVRLNLYSSNRALLAQPPLVFAKSWVLGISAAYGMLGYLCCFGCS